MREWVLTAECLGKGFTYTVTPAFHGVLSAAPWTQLLPWGHSSPLGWEQRRNSPSTYQAYWKATTEAPAEKKTMSLRVVFLRFPT